MENCVARTYELQGSMAPLGFAFRQTRAAAFALPSRHVDREIEELKKSSPLTFLSVDEEQCLIAAAEKLGVALPFLAHP